MFLASTIFSSEIRGSFDYLAWLLLDTFVKNKHPDIRYEVVLAYMPETDHRHKPSDSSITIYPEVLENVPPRFAISRRNKWMVDHSDVVIYYVRHSWGGAAKAVEYARKKGKIMLNICWLENLTKDLFCDTMDETKEK